MSSAALDFLALLAVLVAAPLAAPVAFATNVATIVAPVCICQNPHAHTKFGAVNSWGKKVVALFERVCCFLV